MTKGPSFPTFMAVYVATSIVYPFIYAYVFSQSLNWLGAITLAGVTLSVVGLLGYAGISVVFGLLWWWLSRGGTPNSSGHRLTESFH